MSLYKSDYFYFLEKNTTKLKNKFCQLACGLNFSIVKTTLGDSYVWGNNSDGQHGSENHEWIEKNYKQLESDGKIIIPPEFSYTDRTTFPKKIDIFGINNHQKVTNIAAGFKHVIAVINQKFVYSWGSNEYGQLGIDLQCEKRSVPEKVTELSAIWYRKNGYIDKAKSVYHTG